MIATPPTVPALRSEVMSRTGRLLADAGLYAPRPDGSMPVIDYGLAQGLMDTGMALANPLVPSDDEVAASSPFAIERAVLWAEHHCLKLIVQGWYRVMQTHQPEALSAAVFNSGWLLEQKQGVKGRRDEIARLLAVPFRDTADQMVVSNGMDHLWGLRGVDAVYPGWWPSAASLSPAFFPYGYREWGCS
jgi:hypothetical protein